MVAQVRLNDDTHIPQVGFGTLYVLPGGQGSTESITTEGVVGTAIEVGYRHIDTAQTYGTEQGVGAALANAGLPRNDVYLTSKLGNANHRPDDVRRSIKETLENLRVDRLDLFLMHWPLPMRYDGDYVSTWAAMYDLVKEGQVRTVGVSNFEPHHLDRIIDATGTVPAVNQIELHPYFFNASARQASVDRGVVVEAWSPLGRGAVLEDPVIARAASKHRHSPAQVILRWHVQHGHVVIPKSNNKDRMKQNLGIFDFELSEVEMADIDGLDRGEAGRIGPHPDEFAGMP